MDCGYRAYLSRRYGRECCGVSTILTLLKRDKHDCVVVLVVMVAKEVAAISAHGLQGGAAVSCQKGIPMAIVRRSGVQAGFEAEMFVVFKCIVVVE
jgi:hypothetical protein